MLSFLRTNQATAVRLAKASIIVAGVTTCSVVFATGTLGDVAKNVNDTLSNVAQLIAGASYVAGVGFALAGMIKFKAHKDNPQQVPLSAAITLLAVGAGLVFLPSLIGTAGQTLFAGDAKSGGASGKDVPGLQ